LILLDLEQNKKIWFILKIFIVIYYKKAKIFIIKTIKICMTLEQVIINLKGIMNLLGIILAIIILFFVIWVLYKKNEDIDQDLKNEQQKYFSYFQEIKELKISKKTPEKKFNILNKLAKDFFKQYFKLNHNLTYLQLSENFHKKNKEDFSDFCKSMSDLDYSNKKTDKSQVDKLIIFFERLIENL